MKKVLKFSGFVVCYKWKWHFPTTPWCGQLENEYKILRCSLKSEIDDNKDRLTASEVHAKDLVLKTKNLMVEMAKMKETIQNKSNLVHKLQVQISKIQKDKITMQEKHSLSLKLNRKKISDLEHQLETASKELSSSLLSEQQTKVLYKYKATNTIIWVMFE